MFRLSPLFQFRHGDHICVFYRSQDALREVLTPYVAAGLRNGERCFCAQKPEVLKHLLYDLNFLGINTDHEIKRGALEVHTEDEAYFPNKRFEPAVMMEMLVRSLEEAQAKGFTALRTAGELSWAARGRHECDQLIEYENMVDQCFPGKRVIGLCQYAVDEFDPQVLESVIAIHRLHLAEPPDSMHATLSIRYGECSVEIVADKFVLDPQHYYVVQRQRHREILGWGIAPTLDSATVQAEELVRETAGPVISLAANSSPDRFYHSNRQC